MADVPGESAALFGSLTGAGVNVDVIMQNPECGALGAVGVAFSCPQPEGGRAVEALRSKSGWDVDCKRQLGKVTLWGAGFRTHPMVVADFMDAMSAHGIRVSAITTSAIQVSALVDGCGLDTAVLVLKTRFCL